MESLAFEIYEQLLTAALPVAITFEVANLIVSTFLRAAFGGRLWFGR